MSDPTADSRCELMKVRSTLFKPISCAVVKTATENKIKNWNLQVERKQEDTEECVIIDLGVGDRWNCSDSAAFPDT